MSESMTVAISPQDHKLASLLFDRVLPLHTSDSVPESIRYIAAPGQTEPLAEVMLKAIALAEESPEAKSYPDGEASYVLKTIHNIFAAQYQKALAAQGINAVALYHSQSAYRQSLEPGPQKVIETIVSGVPLIDTTNLEWTHILDIRADDAFRRKLKRFRLFLYDHYLEKDRAYISDDIEVRIEAYQEECRRHGLSLISGSLTQLVDSKALLGSLGLAASALLSGHASIAGIGLAAGGALEIGRIALTIAEKRLAFVNSHAEIAYLAEVRNFGK